MAVQQEWWRDKMAEDIYATMRFQEQSLPTLNTQQGPHHSLRRHLVDLLAVVTEQLGICSESQHLAVFLLDHLLEKVAVQPGFIHLAALTCLLVAVKFEDSQNNVPTHKELNSFLPYASPVPLGHPVPAANHMTASGLMPPGGVSSVFPANQNGACGVTQPDVGQYGDMAVPAYTSKQYCTMERILLKYSSWKLFVPTTAHFLPYFMKVAVDDDDLRDGAPVVSKDHIEKYLHKHVHYFREISLQDMTFLDYPPSMVAAACIAASRLCLHLTPTWPKQLELMTDYYLEELLPCVQPMLQIFQRDSTSSHVPSTYLPVTPLSVTPLSAYQQGMQAAYIPGVSCFPYQPVFVNHPMYVHSKVSHPTTWEY